MFSHFSTVVWIALEIRAGAIKLIFASRKETGKAHSLKAASGTLFCQMVKSQLRPHCPACLEPHGGSLGSGQKLPWFQHPPWDKLLKMELSWPTSHPEVPRATSAQRNAVPEPCGFLKQSSSPSWWEEPPSLLPAACRRSGDSSLSIPQEETGGWVTALA